jgi:hypothetical protein
MKGGGHSLNLRYYHSIFLEGLRKAMKSVIQDCWSADCGLNLGPHEYNAKW